MIRHKLLINKIKSSKINKKKKINLNNKKSPKNKKLFKMKQTLSQSSIFFYFSFLKI